MSGGGSSTDTNTQTDRGTANSAESIGTGQSILQSIAATGYLRGGASDPRVQAATLDTQKEELSKQLALAQQRYDENLSAIGTNPAARGNVDALFSQMSGLRQQMADLDASKSVIMQNAGITQQAVDIAKQFGNRLQTGLETGNFVDPAEMDAMRTAASQLSQDVATTRGLNRTDVPVMQAIAPTLASMWLGQQNTNKAFYTGALQANQGLGLQANQGLMNVNNPGLGISSVNAGVRGSNVTGTSNTQNRPGGLDYLNATSNLAQGVGSAMTGYYGSKGMKGG